MDLKEQQVDVNTRHPWEIARFKVIMYLFRKIKTPNKLFTILDVGCGDLYIAEQFIQRYPESTYFAVDSSFTKQEILILNRRYREQQVNIRVFRSVNEIPHTDGLSVDYVFLFDVLEHVENESTLLNEIKQSVKNNTDIKWLITVPSFNFLFSKHDTFLKHYRRYNKKQLGTMLFANGLLECRSGSFFFSLIAPRLLNLVLDKISPNRKFKGIGQWKFGLALSLLISNLLYIDFRFLNVLTYVGIKLPGLSNYCICQKLAS